MTQAAAPDPLAALRAWPSAPPLAAAVGGGLAAARRESRPGAWSLATAELPEGGTLTPLGDAAGALADPSAPGAARLLGVLLALWAEETAARGAASEAALALCWAAAHTPVSAFEYLEPGHPATPALWAAAGDLSLAHDGAAGAPSRAEALTAAAALAASAAPAARDARAAAAAACRDPLVRVVLSGGGAGTVTGELSPAPRGPVVTLLLGACGWLLVAAGARGLARLALDLRRPAELGLTPAGLLVRWRTELRGKVLRERELVIPLGALAAVTREVRYSRAALYAGIAALALGSYTGMALFVDGVRVPGTSPALLGMGLLVLGLGVVADYGLSVLPSAARARCRVVVTRLRGSALCVGGVDPIAADAMLGAVLRRLGAR